jgi:hypothetical protein
MAILFPILLAQGGRLDKQKNDNLYSSPGFVSRTSIIAMDEAQLMYIFLLKPLLRNGRIKISYYRSITTKCICIDKCAFDKTSRLILPAMMNSPPVK